MMDNRIAAAQLATLLLFTVALILWVEQRAQSRMRFAAGRGARGRRSDGGLDGLAAPPRAQRARLTR